MGSTPELHPRSKTAKIAMPKDATVCNQPNRSYVRAQAGRAVTRNTDRMESLSLRATLMRLLFTADTHFGHGGALGLYRRPFASVANMDAALIERWNRVVAATDDLYHLGDF